MYDSEISLSSNNYSNWAIKYNLIASNIPHFNFVPTPSALGIGNGVTALTLGDYNARYIGALPPALPLNSPFANFTTAFGQVLISNGNVNNNENHIQISPRNGNFIAGELNRLRTIPIGNPPLTNCAAYCSNNTITGNLSLCNSSVQTTLFDNNATYTWSINNTSIASITPNQNSVTVTRTGSSNGSLTLSVNVSSAGCGTTTLTKSIDIGAPVGNISFQRIGSTCYYQAVFNSTQTQNTYEWSDDGISYSPSGSGNTYGMYLPVPGNNIPVYARATNLCGTLNRQKNFTLTSSPGGCTYRAGQKPVKSSSVNIEKAKNNLQNEITIYPNPAYENWQVVVKDFKTAKSIQFTLNDISGRTIWNSSYNSKLLSILSIPGQNLSKGIYFLKVLIDGKVQVFKLEKI